MPELPEVETVRRGLEPVLVDQCLVRVEQRRPDLRVPFPDEFVRRIEGCRVMRLARRAKYLVAELDSGEALIMHLGMSGRFTIESAEEAAQAPGAFTHDRAKTAAHDHVVFHVANGARVTYNDPRRFGFMDLVAQDALEACRHFAAMGIEPLGNQLNAAYIAGRAAGRTTDLKAFLLDQRHIAGLGNIYVCEALYRARLSPRRLAGSLANARGKPTARAERLVPRIREVLDDAIAAGGSTLRDYRAADGALGYFQHTFAVYGREGEPCSSDGCRGKVQRITQAGRSTFFCGRCQK
ncbi:MAG: bifunctional DNA-formamidopyrimidine glycosylase/DNA-(apurinic or apyrimidinic site) lyase [Hyphomicrobiaceae bacterium]